MLDREESPGPREAALHLVADHDDPVLVADRTDALDELLGRRDEPTLTLDRLEDDRGNIVGGDECLECTADRVDVVERDAVDLRRERPETFLVRPRLRRERERQ